MKATTYSSEFDYLYCLTYYPLRSLTRDDVKHRSLNTINWDIFLRTVKKLLRGAQDAPMHP